MANNQNVNKVIYGNEVLIDLTADTVTADKLASGYTAHGQSGAIITGTNTFDSNTQDANAVIAEVLEEKSFYARGSKLTGTMPNRGAVNGIINTKAQQYDIPQGYHDGSGKVGISSTEQAKIIPGNIKQGVTMLGVTGTLEPSSNVTVQSKTVSPKVTAQTVLPDSSYDYLSQVTVSAIPYVETDNSAGGKTVTIAGVS